MFIGTKYKVENDTMNFILKAKTTKKQKAGEEDDDFENREEGWTIEGYFYDFRELLKFIADNEIKGTGLSDLKAVAKTQDALYDLICSLKKITPHDLLPKADQMPQNDVIKGLQHASNTEVKHENLQEMLAL